MTQPGKPIATIGVPFFGFTLQVDPYSLHPLAEALMAQRPAEYARAYQLNGPPPQMFSAGPLPAFTASGVDPAQLARVPYSCRHVAAAEPDSGKVFGIVESYSNQPNSRLSSPQLTAYQAATERWMVAPGPVDGGAQ